MKPAEKQIGPSQRPQVIWITGLSGAGKSTLARRVVQSLRAQGLAVLLLDGDDVRQAIADPQTGHDRASRLTNAMRISRLAKLLAEQGFLVVVPTMSLFQEVHRWNRDHLPNYLEVWIQVRLEILQQRDARGLYSRASRGEVENVVGVHVDYDEPREAHLILQNESDEAGLDQLVEQVLQRVAGDRPCA